MIRFSARGAYLLLVPQGRALIGDRALIRDRMLISFLRNYGMFKTEGIYLKGEKMPETFTVTNTRVNVQ